MKKQTTEKYTTSYGEEVSKIRIPYAFPKWAKREFGTKWLSNKTLIGTYSLEQMLLCLKKVGK